MMKKILNSDYFLRTISLLVALVLWMYVVSINNPRVEIPISSVPIEIINTENLNKNGLEIISVSDLKTTVKVVGRMSEVSAISAEDVRVYVDAEDVYSANSYYLDTISEIDSNTVAVSNVDVKSVNLYVDYVLAVEKDIEIMVVGEPKVSYVFDKAVPAHAKAVIKGPQNLINQVSSLKATLDISNANSSYSTVCPVKMYTANGEVINSEYLSTTISDVAVDVSLNYYNDVKLNVVLPEGINSDEYVVTFSPESVRVLGNQEVVSLMNEILVNGLSELDFSNDHTVKELDLPVIQDISYADNVKTVVVEIKPAISENNN